MSLDGAVEVSIELGVADAIADVVETGTTLRQAGLETFGEPLHSLVIVGRRLHHLEVEYAESFAVNRETWREVARSAYGCALE